jgi:hypothetical protein
MEHNVRLGHGLMPEMLMKTTKLGRNPTKPKRKMLLRMLIESGSIEFEMEGVATGQLLLLIEQMVGILSSLYLVKIWEMDM